MVLIYGSRDPGRVLFRDELELLARRGDAEILLTVDDTGRRSPGRAGAAS